tara:strand:+ start:160 stop:732 length:573 start_codon:yes stop_codon:yes gene_type:complete
MAEVKVLIEGYVSGKDYDNSCCTISLVTDGKIKMLVDPGTVKDQKLIVKALKKEKLKVSDINYVFITHSHMDHYRNIGMFPKAKALDFYGIWEKDTVIEWKEKFTENIEIVKTPGHDRTGITLFVKTEKGIVGVCGDVFWKENFPEKDLYASDREKLKKSRELVVEKADFIVPGHEGIFKVEKDENLLRL